MPDLDTQSSGGRLPANDYKRKDGSDELVIEWLKLRELAGTGLAVLQVCGDASHREPCPPKIRGLVIFRNGVDDHLTVGTHGDLNLNFPRGRSIHYLVWASQVHRLHPGDIGSGYVCSCQIGQSQVHPFFFDTRRYPVD